MDEQTTDQSQDGTSSSPPAPDPMPTEPHAPSEGPPPEVNQ